MRVHVKLIVVSKLNVTCKLKIRPKVKEMNSKRRINGQTQINSVDLCDKPWQNAWVVTLCFAKSGLHFFRFLYRVVRCVLTQRVNDKRDNKEKNWSLKIWILHEYHLVVRRNCFATKTIVECFSSKHIHTFRKAQPKFRPKSN